MTRNGAGIETMKSVVTRLLVMVALSGCVAGCTVGRATHTVADAGKVFMVSQDLGPTLTQSSGEHMHVITAVIDRDARAFFHDLDMLYMTERPTRLTPWHDR